MLESVTLGNWHFVVTGLKSPKYFINLYNLYMSATNVFITTNYINATRLLEPIICNTIYLSYILR